MVQIQCLQNALHKGRGGDEAHGVHAHVHQAAHVLRQLGRGKVTPQVAVADVPVLAVGAAQGAAAEKQRPGAANTADGRFLPVVGGYARQAQGAAQAAKAVAPLRGTAGVAVTGTEGTVFHGGASLGAV